MDVGDPQSSHHRWTAPIVVSGSDDLLLRTVHRYHFLTVGQMLRLHYRAGSLTYARARLKRLADARYLQRLYPPRAAAAGGSPLVYTLARRGLHHLQAAGLDVAHRFRPAEHRTHSSLFLAHTLAVNDVLIAAELLPSAVPGVALFQLRHERDLRRTPVYVEAEGRVAVIPDGFLDFRIGGTVQMCIALELDRGTIEARPFRHKIGGLLAFASGPYQRAFRTASLTIAFVVDAPPDRLAQLLSWTEQELRDRQREEMGDLFRLAPLPADGIDPRHFFLGPCWRRPFDPVLHPLLCW